MNKNAFRTSVMLGMGALMASAVLPAWSQSSNTDAAAPREYLVTLARPNQLYVIDTETREITRTCDLPGDSAPGTIQLSPDNRIAYVLHNRWEDATGVDLTNCDIVFRAQQSSGNERVKSIASIALSPDGTHLYTVQNPVKMFLDHYEVQEPRVAIFDTADGLDAQPIKTYPVPRQIATIATDADGWLYLGGADIYRMDTQTGEWETAIANRNWDRTGFSRPDSLAMWSTGEVSQEFLRPYSVAKLENDEPVSFHWGISRIDLETGEIENKEIGPFEFIIFSMVSDPNSPDDFYGVYTQLSHYDAETQELVKVIDLDHTYYNINSSYDGKTLYLGGASSDIAIYDTEFNDLGRIELPGDMGAATLKVARF
ncbi:quinohemoprotein amine dehydrogenase subunit beta [Billgrantia saliphila]|uniref:quinohemoprotein amine dehydrogenase subunit beta n=1 Tax=Billgrantia saliphila TaxID=1848458 RepID=UPI001E3EE20E|nr:quinohemoprotein amine dehydrogenase subunit beta [Halomonas saliphila]